MSPTRSRQAELLLDVRNHTGECPVWNAATQSLYWVDIPANQLNRYRLSDQTLQQWNAPEMLACITRSAVEGQWIAGAQTGVFRATAGPTGGLNFTSIAPVEHAMAGMRFNDGRCDRQGRFLAGTMLMDMPAAAPVGAIYRLGADGALKKLLDGFVTPNGMAFSPDGRTMYLSDSHPSVRRVWRYAYDTERGIPGNPTPFLDMGHFAGRPDGAAMDTDGCYWICGIDAGLVHRYTPQGRHDFSIKVPVAKPTMCAFGGADLRTLYITSIRPANAADTDPAGGLFAIHLHDVQGFPESACSTH